MASTGQRLTFAVAGASEAAKAVSAPTPTVAVPALAVTWRVPVEQGPSFTDITVITDHWTERHDEESPAGEPGVELAPGLWLERLPVDQVDQCVDACRERGLNFDGGKSTFSQLYSFVRRYPPDEPPKGSEYGFDPDGLIELAIRMSRLIVLNSHSTEWSVRRLSNVFPMAEQPQLVPLRCYRRFFGTASQPTSATGSSSATPKRSGGCCVASSKSATRCQTA